MEAQTLREHGLRIGALEAGPANSIADVTGIAVGHVTVVRDEPDPPDGRGVARSGVTAVVPGPVERIWAEPMQAGVAVLNGAGELTGSFEIAEWGWLASPVYLTATMSTGRVYDGAVAAAVATDPRIGVEEVTIPVVGECDDSWLNDARVVQVEAEDVRRALDAATTSFAQGAVGAGTGMICFDWKGGIGSSSRVTGEEHTVGVLVLANFGDVDQLRIDGVPVGRLLVDAGLGPPVDQYGPTTPWPGRRAAEGSCIAVVATDAPLGAAQLARVATRAGLGLARTGSVGHNGSGEIFVAFSTTSRSGRGEPPPAPGVANADLNPLFSATVDATEEAVVNCLWAAETTTGRDNRTIERLPHEPVLELLAEHNRL
ncbi:MAG TPA: P1 family peptidase [Thermoleophilaceae bacterium]|jgi:D-aminopeptidase